MPALRVQIPQVDSTSIDGGTALCGAAHHGKEKCVELLLAARAAVDLATNSGATALNSAVLRLVERFDIEPFN